MIKAIIFDLGNVLILHDKEEFILKVLSKYKISNRELFQKIELESRLKMDYGEITSHEYIRNINKQTGSNIKEKDYYNIFFSKPQSKLNTNLIGLIKELRRKYKIFLLANNNKPMHEFIKSKKLDKLFDKVLFSYQVGLKKPDPKFFERLLSGTKIKSEECVFVDDREDYMPRVKKLKMKTIVYKNFKQLLGDMKTCI